MPLCCIPKWISTCRKPVKSFVTYYSHAQNSANKSVCCIALLQRYKLSSCEYKTNSPLSVINRSRSRYISYFRLRPHQFDPSDPQHRPGQFSSHQADMPSLGKHAVFLSEQLDNLLEDIYWGRITYPLWSLILLFLDPTQPFNPAAYLIS